MYMIIIFCQSIYKCIPGPMFDRDVLDDLVAAECALAPMSTELLLPLVADVL